VMIGTRKLVDGISVDQLVGVPNPLNNNFRRVAFTSDNATATGLAGGAGAIVTARDSDIAGIIQSINDVASALITAVNAYHRTGYGLDGVTGRDFFAGADASTIDLNPQLVDHPERFAAANVANEPGNTEVARLIAGVQYERVLSGNTVTIDDAYRTAVARLGVAAQQANQRADNQDALTRNLSMARQSVAGINVDEEMLNLQKGQHAYQAAARVITTVDEMLDTLINRTFR
jgi:flagellar hook-associated protein 1